MFIDQNLTLPKPDIVLFDLDNTLYPYEPCNTIATETALKAAALRFNLDLKNVLNAYSAARLIVKSRLGCIASRHSRILYFHSMLEQLGLGSQVEEALRLEQLYWRVYLTRMELFPYAREYLANLRSYGVKLGLVTDLTAQIQFRKIVLLNLSSVFDAVVTSEETHGEKETEAPYRLIREKLVVDKSETIWMIGDSEVDACPAKRALNAFTICFTGGLKDNIPKTDAKYDSFYDLNKATDEVFRDA